MGIQVSEETTLATGVVSNNVLANTQLDYMPYDGVLEVAVTGGGADLRGTLSVSDQLVIRDQLMNPATTHPVAPDDFTISTGAVEGARIDLSFRNASAANRTVKYIVHARPIG